MSVQHDLTQCVTQSKSQRPAYNTIPRTHAPIPCPSFAYSPILSPLLASLLSTQQHIIIDDKAPPWSVVVHASHRHYSRKKEKERRRERRRRTEHVSHPKPSCLSHRHPPPLRRKERERKKSAKEKCRRAPRLWRLPEHVASRIASPPACALVAHLLLVHPIPHARSTPP